MFNQIRMLEDHAQAMPGETGMALQRAVEALDRVLFDLVALGEERGVRHNPDLEIWCCRLLRNLRDPQEKP